MTQVHQLLGLLDHLLLLVLEVLLTQVTALVCELGSGQVKVHQLLGSPHPFGTHPEHLLVAALEFPSGP